MILVLFNDSIIDTLRPKELIMRRGSIWQERTLGRLKGFVQHCVKSEIEVLRK